MAQHSDKVFVVHGRNAGVRRALFRFLRSIGLRPIEWSQAIELTGKAAPYIGEVLDVAFSEARAIVVLMTPDDEAQLREIYRDINDPPYESVLTGQARPNVLFEAGMAMGRSPERTVLVEIGKLRPFSDIGGRHIISLNNSLEARQNLAQRLTKAGCPVDLVGTDWHREGDFDITTSNPNNPTTEEVDKETTSSIGRRGSQKRKWNESAILAFCGQLASYDDFYMIPDIPAKILKNAKDRFVPKREKIIAFLDNTDAYSGCNGLAIAISSIYWRNNHNEESQVLLWQQLADLPIRASEQYDQVWIGPNLTIDLSGSNIRATDLARCLRDIVKLFLSFNEKA